jgi:hypothetical protein
MNRCAQSIGAADNGYPTTIISKISAAHDAVLDRLQDSLIGMILRSQAELKSAHFCIISRRDRRPKLIGERTAPAVTATRRHGPLPAEVEWRLSIGGREGGRLPEISARLQTGMGSFPYLTTCDEFNGACLVAGVARAGDVP